MKTPFLFALLALSFWSCEHCGETPKVVAVVDAGPPTLLEKEPNDSAAAALVIERTTIVDANLGADPQKPDADWYLLRASRPTTVDFKVSCPPGADVGLEVVDESGTVLSSVNAGAAGAAERIPNLDVAAKTFVRAVSHKKGVGGAYQVSAEFKERLPGYELEPNERKVEATAVALGQAISGFVSHGGDTDWYRYELPSDAPAGGSELPSVAPENDGGIEESPSVADAGAAPDKRLALRIDLSAVESVAYELSVLTEAEAVLFSAKSKEGAPLSLRNVGVRAADKVIYVMVRSAPVGSGKDARRGANVDSSYTLTVAPEDLGDNAELEPNDDAAHASEVPANSYRDGFISPKGDVDVYRLTTPGPSIVQFQATGVDKVDLVLSVVRPVEGKGDEVLFKTNEGATREPEQLNSVACDGVCYVRVEAALHKIDGKWVADDENADQSYRLSALVVPDDGTQEKENNNAAVTATPIRLSSPIRGTIYPKKDVDFFSLDLRERPVKTALKATLTGILKVDVGLYLHRVDEEGKLSLVQTADGAKGERPEIIRFAAEPGLYVLEVRDTKNREGNFQDSYQLIVEEGGE